MAKVRRLSRVAGIILVAAGLVWLLQGTRVLPGSFMTGSALWTGIGALSITVGALLVLSSGPSRRRPR